MNHPLQCRCGKLKGVVAQPQSGNRVICYCGDCQAFARWLGGRGILDACGGSDIVQMLPKHITFTQGLDQLACIRLTPKGLLRWYAACCRTPIGNTLHTSTVSFIGLVHTCLESPDSRLEHAFGPVRATVNTNGANANPKPKTRGMGTVILWFFTTVLRARISGDYKRTAFFDETTGTPIVAPCVLPHEELARVRGS